MLKLNFRIERERPTHHDLLVTTTKRAAAKLLGVQLLVVNLAEDLLFF